MTRLRIALAAVLVLAALAGAAARATGAPSCDISFKPATTGSWSLPANWDLGRLPADGEVKYAAHTGGRGQYAHVKIHVYPAEPGTGCTFEDRIVVGAIPKAFIRPIEEGIQEAMTRGVLAGYPVEGVRVELYDGSYHDVDSSDEAFRIAARIAFQKAAREGRPLLLEPIMRVEVTAPREYADDLIRSVSKRRGHIRSHDDRGSTAIVEARVPLSGMLGYAADLRSRTEGRGSFVMTFDSYQPVVAGEDGSDESTVGAPLKPSPISGESRVALPEPGEDADE